MPAKTAKAPAKKARTAKLAKTTKKARTAKKATTAKTAKLAKLVPLGDRILIKQVRQDEVRASGLVIPDTAREKPQMGEVLAVGPGRLDDNGKRLPMDVKVGDRVLYADPAQEVRESTLEAQRADLAVIVFAQRNVQARALLDGEFVLFV
ncbi:hypothetical protein LCGC14_2709280, partial [marine sediment metagenome]